ncbi:MAG: TolC family protein [Peptococcaceae bacterium]|nr:TolC family protein [Peptococcaceae bacterium]
MGKKIIILLTLILAMAFASPASAEDDLKISLEDAVKMALDGSRELKASQKDIDVQEKDVEDARTDVKYAPIGPGYGQADKPVFLKYFNAEYQMKLLKKQFENSRIQLVIDTKKAYYNCLVLEQKKEAQKKTVDLYELKLAQEKARYGVGMSTESSVNSALSQLATEKANLEDVIAKLDKAYSDLNTLLGLGQGARPVLTSGITAEFSKLDDVELEVSRAMDGSLEVWTAAESSKLATQLKIFEDLYKVGEYKQEKAFLQEAITVDKVKAQIRDLCNSINYMAEKNNQLAAQLKEAEEACRVQKAFYDQGMVTRDALLNVETKRLSLLAGVKELSAQYAAARDTLDKYQGKLKI